LTPGIGANCHIEKAISDKNVCLGNTHTITPRGLSDTMTSRYWVRDEIVIISKNLPCQIVGVLVLSKAEGGNRRSATWQSCSSVQDPVPADR
jgi:hypothetical protein